MRHSKISFRDSAEWTTDIQEIENAARLLFPDRPDRQDEYVTAPRDRSFEFVENPTVWARIERVAMVLARRGTLRGRRVDVLIDNRTAARRAETVAALGARWALQ